MWANIITIFAIVGSRRGGGDGVKPVEHYLVSKPVLKITLNTTLKTFHNTESVVYSWPNL